jgi:hypothetical protein
MDIITRTPGYGDTPYVVRGTEIDPKRIFKSKFDLALRNDITMVAGYGIVPQGAVIATVLAGTRKNSYVPYVPVTPVAGGDLAAIGAAYLMVDGAASTAVHILMDDSYKFAVGDELAVADSDTNGASAVNLGAITAIDRTTYSYKAVLTVTNNVTTDFTVANSAWVYIKTKATAPFTQAKGILESGTDTGEGVNAKGGQRNIILSNAMLYTDMLINLTSEAKTDLGTVDHGKYTLLK